jgi:hypothetical protein
MSSKSYLRGLKMAQKIIRREYETQKLESPGNLDGYTFGWLSQTILSYHKKKLKSGKKSKTRN